MYHDLFEKIINGDTAVALVGLGYVGLPIAVAFAKKVRVIGFDVNKKKIEMYRAGKDPTNEVGDDVVAHTSMIFSSEEAVLKNAKFHIVAVPTPVNADHTPDLSPVQSASEVVGRNLTKGSIVVFESTVYPGVTEEICIPILEKHSGFVCGVDFKIGYSPERINPGDKVHRLDTITKIVSGMDEETLDIVAKVYGLVITAGVYKAESVKIAEAAKIIENSQRDINIAFMNELSIIFNEMGIDTQAVLKAAGTKWNFLKFCPGLVGGHCIGVDPYYLTYKAEGFGYHSQIIAAGRRINDDMGKYIARNIIKYLIKAHKNVNHARVAIFGLTFKENCPDTRNTKVIDVINELKEYDINPLIVDPVADKKEAGRLYGVDIIPEEEVCDMDAIVIAVRHKEFEHLTKEYLDQKYRNGKKVLFDIKGCLEKKEFQKEEYLYWRL